MRKMVNHVCVRTGYDDPSGFFTPDKDGVLVTFGEKETSETVEELVIFVNKKIPLKDVKVLIEKVLVQMNAEIKRRENEKPKQQKGQKEEDE